MSPLPETAGQREATPDRLHASVHCPGCNSSILSKPLELFHGTSLYACHDCDLHFWHPVSRPDATWHETAYQGRDRTAMPLEPGHKFFLADPNAPRGGRLLDLGCGVGNFLAAARKKGFEVQGVEFNHNAVLFAQSHYGIQSVFADSVEGFRSTHPAEQFDVVSFFEVLEHQEDPASFLAIARAFLAPGGHIALSVPNRNRWLHGFESLDFPPNHLTRWSPRALRNFLERNGFEVLSLREEPLGVRRAAQVLSMGVRSGLIAHVAGEQPPTPADLAEMSAAEMEEAIRRSTQSVRHRLAAHLASWKNFAMFPAATLLLPYLRLRGSTGLYLYCLARKIERCDDGASAKEA
jgi:SAM-dependent methyltransferase